MFTGGHIAYRVGLVVRVDLPTQKGEELTVELSQPLHHQRLHDRKYLLDLAAAQGVPFNARSLTNWGEHGLIPPPQQHGRGKGKGSIAGWTSGQVEEWLTLLYWYQHNVPFRALYNLPVYEWLYGGEMMGVSLPQVQRAMHHWARIQPLVLPHRKARREARGQVKALARPAAKGILALIRELTAWYAGHDLYLPELEYWLEPVVDPCSPDHQLRFTAHQAAVTMWWMKTGRDLGLESLAAIPPTLWEWARTQVLLNEAEEQLGVETLGKALASGSITFRHRVGKDLFSVVSTCLPTWDWPSSLPTCQCPRAIRQCFALPTGQLA